jgi:hypothetical protein
VTANGTSTFLGQFGNGNNVNEKIIQFLRASSSTDIVNIQGINAGVGASNIALQALGGNVGIGSTSPAERLHVETSNEYQITYARTLIGKRWALGIDTGGTYFNNRTDSILPLYITNAGNVLIGTTTDPGAKLYVLGAAVLGPSNTGLGIGSISGIRRIQWNESTSELEVYNSSNAYAPIGASAFNTRSDYRLKEDLKQVNGLEKINSINVYNYKWKESETRMDGVLAHELAEVLPYAVSGQKDGEQMQGVDYSKIVPLLIQSIKELKQEIDTLKN